MPLATLRMEGVRVVGNKATDRGGGVHVVAGRLEMKVRGTGRGCTAAWGRAPARCRLYPHERHKGRALCAEHV